MLFGSKKSLEKTVLILDVESGSVGSALVRLAQDNQPKMFGEMRSHAPLGARVTGIQLSADIQQAATAALRHAGEVAGRVRNAVAGQTREQELKDIGTVERVAVFLAPPWGRPNLDRAKPDFMPEMSEYLRNEIGAVFGDTPVSFYTSAGATAFGVRSLFAPEPCLVCSVTGEVSELMRMDGQGVRAHATIPTGFHSLLRTLRAHGGLSEPEARSMVRLASYPEQSRGGRPSTALRIFDEPFATAASHFAGQFKDAAKELLSPGDVLRVRIIGAEPVGEWFARALSADESLAELFPDGGEVRAARAHHLTPHIEAHAEVPDLFLMLDAFFMDSGV